MLYTTIRSVKQLILNFPPSLYQLTLLAFTLIQIFITKPYMQSLHTRLLKIATVNFKSLTQPRPLIPTQTCNCDLCSRQKIPSIAIFYINRQLYFLLRWSTNLIVAHFMNSVTLCYLSTTFVTPEHYFR